MSRKEIALKKFSKGFSCSQAVLVAFSEDLGVDEELALKISSGFGGGIKKGEVCGAVSGAIMALGLKEGYYVEGDMESKSKISDLTKEFLNRFEEKNGSMICKKLLGLDLTKPEEYKMIKEKGLFESQCPLFIEDAIVILEDMIDDQKR